MPLVKCINGHTGCAAAERYLERGSRAIGHDFINLDCMEREDGAVGWAAEMDELRGLHRNGEPYRGKPAITYRHYIVSPDPDDKVDLGRLRELAVAWAERHFGDYQVAIVYHDDNEHRIPHAHVVVNNTNVETGKRLHIPQPKELNRDLQRMARERDLGYLTDNPSFFNRRTKGCKARTTQREFKGKAERRIEREGGYSWVADIRNRASTARALAVDEESYRDVLEVLGVELSLNSPNARRRDYLYALADHPSRKVGGEKLGQPYGKAALEFEWISRSPFKEQRLKQIVEHAVLLRDIDELHEMARAMEAIKGRYLVSIADIDRTINNLEKRADGAASPEDRTGVVEELEQMRHARRFAAEHGILPAENPNYFRGHGSRSDSSFGWGGHSGSHSESRAPERSIERSTGGWER